MDYHIYVERFRSCKSDSKQIAHIVKDAYLKLNQIPNQTYTTINKVFQIIKDEARKVDIIEVNKISHKVAHDPVKFVEEFKLREHISPDKLPCIVTINGRGDINTYKNLNESYKNKDYTFMFKLDHDYYFKTF